MNAEYILPAYLKYPEQRGGIRYTDKNNREIYYPVYYFVFYIGKLVLHELFKKAIIKFSILKNIFHFIFDNYAEVFIMEVFVYEEKSEWRITKNDDYGRSLWNEEGEGVLALIQQKHLSHIQYFKCRFFLQVLSFFTKDLSKFHKIVLFRNFPMDFPE